MSEIAKPETERFKYLKMIIGSFRLMHFLPVVTVTTLGAITAVLALKGDGTFSELFTNIGNGTIKIASFIFFLLTVFFQSAFLGIQNDYIDRELDIKYQKSKAIVDGWVSEKLALWLTIISYVLFTGFSIGLGFYAEIGFWTILYVQGANLIGLFYNLYAKHKPISIIPHMIGQPFIPIFAWLTFGGFEWYYLWVIPVIIFMAFPAHIANEIADIELDIEYGKRNFAVVLGRKAATIAYWIAIGLIDVVIIIVFVLYGLNLWLFLGIIILSTMIYTVALILLARNEWNTTIPIFDVVTAGLGVQVLGVFILLLM